MNNEAKLTRDISRVISANQHLVADIYAKALCHAPRWDTSLDKAKGDWDSFLEMEFFAYADYLAQFFADRDDTFKQLLIGEKIKSLYDASLDDDAKWAQAELVFNAELAGFEKLIRPKLDEKQWNILNSELRIIQNVLVAKPKYKQRILFIGDCLFLDIVPFMVGSLLDVDIAIQPDYVTSKNSSELRDQLRKFSTEKFDLVFYSPFTYEFSPELTELTDWKKPFISNQVCSQTIDKAWSEVDSTVKVIAEMFDCPIHVHNASFVVREDNDFKRFIKNKITSRKRNYAKKRLHKYLECCIDKINNETFRHVFIFDEVKFVDVVGEQQAGAFYYNSHLQHPAVLGRIFAQAYVDIIYTNAHLSKKKLVVSDLDNTLWDGVIGDGDVKHYHERQLLLKQLKSKGVVLAVNSKNDSANVHWRGATLTEDDFVYAAISWSPKVQAMKTIENELNLKMKSFVFIDDRKDELELMSQTYPDVLCLDANNPETWNRIQLWHDLLEVDMDMDRTLMYKQREDRKAYINEDITSDEEKAALFASLGLKLKIKRPELTELKRVAELINRTNQFNLEGAKTTVKEVTEWYQSGDYLILTGQTSDRFGDMGVTCVAVAKYVDQDLIMKSFVLSCRVFGYRFEHCVMNHIKRLAARRGANRILGKYIATAQNAPCKDFFAECGFKESNGVWVYFLNENIEPDATWLTVVSE